MDSASWRLLVRVAQDHPRVLIALTARPTAIGQEFQALKRTSGFNEMLLAPLRDEAISTIVAGVVDAGSIRPALLEDITHQAKGNPLFAREYALLLATRSRVAPPRVDQPGPIDT